jgi:hypothetical protein
MPRNNSEVERMLRELPREFSAKCLATHEGEVIAMDGSRYYQERGAHDPIIDPQSGGPAKITYVHFPEHEYVVRACRQCGTLYLEPVSE